jgi:hypothetical protein
MKTIKNIVVLVFVGLLFLSCNKNEEAIELVETKSVFAGRLAFEKIKDIPENQFEDQMPGFLANPSDNSLYISCRNKNLTYLETTYKLNLNDLKLISKNATITDFVTKRNYIYNNQLYVFGAEKYTIYDLDLNTTTPSTPYLPNNLFSRFGFIAQNENVYIIGGFLGGSTQDPTYNKKIYNLNLNTNKFLEFATMPKNRNGSSAEIVDNKIYSFFGYENIKSNTTSPSIQMLDDLQIYDINSNSFQTINLAKNVKVSFTAKYKNYIFVAGNKTAGSTFTVINGSFFGYFDTKTNVMTEIPITVENNNLNFPYICEIEVMNNKIYALVKNSFNSFSIQVANLN